MKKREEARKKREMKKKEIRINILNEFGVALQQYGLCQKHPSFLEDCYSCPAHSNKPDQLLFPFS